MGFYIDKKHPVCGHISQVWARLQEVKDRAENKNAIILVATPFGILECRYVKVIESWDISGLRHRLKVPEAKTKALLYTYKNLVGLGNSSSTWVPWGVFRNPNYKFRKNRKSKAICPGLDLRPLQQEYRRKLGNLHRFKHALQQIKALYPRVFWDSFDHAPDYFSIKAMEKYLKDNYAYDKQRMIDAYERSKK